jgi:hypothetical protein
MLTIHICHNRNINAGLYNALLMQVSIPGICQQSGHQLELELDDLVAYYNRIILDPDSPEGGHTIQAEAVNRQMPCKWAAWQVVDGGAVLYHDASSNAVESWNNRMLLGRQNMQLGMLLPYVFDMALQNTKRVYLHANRTYRRLNKEFRVDERKLRMLREYSVSRAEGVRGVFCVSRAKEGVMRKHWVDVQKKHAHVDGISALDTHVFMQRYLCSEATWCTKMPFMLLCNSLYCGSVKSSTSCGIESFLKHKLCLLRLTTRPSPFLHKKKESKEGKQSADIDHFTRSCSSKKAILLCTSKFSVLFIYVFFFFNQQQYPIKNN